MFRRSLHILLAAFLAAAPAAAQSPEPAAVVDAIYKKAAEGKGDVGGQFLWLEAKDRARTMSKSLIALWAKADKHTRAGEGGPIDFDPVTNSQDPSVGTYTVKVEKQTPKAATVTATFSRRAEHGSNSRPETVRYDLVLEDGAWRIDDIKGRIQTPWSVRKMLRDFLKT